MTRQEFNTWIKSEGLTTIHTGCGDYVYFDGTDAKACKEGCFFGCFKVQLLGSKWKLMSYDKSGSYDEATEVIQSCKSGYTDEAVALDDLKLQIEAYRNKTKNWNTRNQMGKFIVQLLFKKIEAPVSSKRIGSDNSYDISIEQLDALLHQYCPQITYIYDGSITLINSEHQIICKIVCVRPSKTNYYIPFIWLFDGYMHIGKKKLDEYVADYSVDDTGIYIVYEDGNILMEKYSFDGELIYSCEHNPTYIIRRDGLPVQLMNAESVSEGQMKNMSSIAVSNGRDFIIYNRRNGKALLYKSFVKLLK